MIFCHLLLLLTENTQSVMQALVDKQRPKLFTHMRTEVKPRMPPNEDGLHKNIPDILGTQNSDCNVHIMVQNIPDILATHGCAHLAMGTHKNSQKTSPKEKQKPATLKLLLDLDQDIFSLISLCSHTNTSTDRFESPSKESLKSDRLERIFSIVKSLRNLIPNEILTPLFAMISGSLFRALPPSSTALLSSLPEGDNFAIPTPSWSHLNVVYNILLLLLTNLEEKALSYHINESFILNLLVLFQSEDPREREILKTVYHKIYSKFLPLRSLMRKAMQHVFLDYIFEMQQYRHCGIGDLLEIWGTIVNGFSIPLKEAHKVFLIKVLIPLHRPRGMQAYHKQLVYCISQFVEKEPKLGVLVVKDILRHWPVTNWQKEVLLIGELEKLVDNMRPEQHSNLALPLCRQMTKCMNSRNSQVAERALYLWNNKRIVKMALGLADGQFPVVVEALEKNLSGHWRSSVRQLSENVKEMLEAMEPRLYAKCLSELHPCDSATKANEMTQRLKWERIEIAAQVNKLF